MAYHIIIATERRTPAETPLGTDYSRLAIASSDLLHMCCDRPMPDKDWSDPQFVMVAEWDLRSPYVILHKGTYVPHFAGWPDMTKEQYDALAVAA